MTTFTIAVLPGDGIGPEVVRQGVKILRAVGERFGHAFHVTEGLFGGAAVDVVGHPLPSETLAMCRASDAVLLGAVGGPRWDTVAPDVRPERGLLALRNELGVYANLRPVTVYPAMAAASPLKMEVVERVDLMVVRELTGGIYFGEKKLTNIDGQEHASDLCSYSSGEVERIIRVAAGLARQRRGKLTSVDKANVLETSRLWRRVATRVVGEEFPDLDFEHLLVDACAMHLIKRPRDFDVIVTENMFGDILTDEASMLAGSIGLLPSASLSGMQGKGERRLGLYEPIHGSAPDIAGRGIANPVGTILSVAMLLRHSLGLEVEAQCVEKVVEAAVAVGYMTVDVAPTNPYSTAAVGDYIAGAVLEHDDLQADGYRWMEKPGQTKAPMDRQI